MKFQDYNEAGKKYGIDGGDWLNLEEGDNKVRIVSEFEDYGSHYDKKLKKSFVCLGKEKCPFCQTGDKPRVQFLGWVIDRKDQKPKLLRIGYKIFQQIGDLAQSEDYKFDDVPGYDITIKKTGQGLDTNYSVLPARKNTELTSEEIESIKGLKDPKEIIENMKAKLESSPDVSDEDIPIVEDENIEDVPF